MRKTKLEEMMRAIEQRERISASEVEKEIQLTTSPGPNNRDEKVKVGWAKISFRRRRLTPQEVIGYMCRKLR